MIRVYRKFDDVLSNQVLDILTDCDKEFVPPLSSRNSTTQGSFSVGEAKGEIPAEYFENMKKQPILTAEEDGTVMGFMSFKEDYVSDAVKNEFLPNVYISTVAVHHGYRGRGITKAFYKKLFELYPNRNILTRTWSTNASHSGILSKMGFSEFLRIKDDRGVGTDTVYYCRRPEKIGNFDIL